MSSINPYQPPPDGGGHTGNVAAPHDASAKEVFLAWERLRLPYNIVLMLVTLTGVAILGTEFVRPRQLLFILIFGALLANVCFCAGSCVEGYLSWAGVQRRPARMILFAAGMLLSSLLAVSQIYRIASPPF